jgi:nicotinamide riboside transporter PnuC
MVILSTILVGRKNKWGWVIGILASVGWFIYTINIEEYALALTTFVMFIVRVKSAMQWFRDE